MSGRVAQAAHRRYDPSVMSTGRTKLIRILVRGLRMRCPRCGDGRLFGGWYTLNDSCSVCDLDHAFAEGNTWAFMYISTAAMTGLIVAVMILVRPDSLWKGQAVVFPVALVLIVGSLPHRKGLAIALEFLVERHCRHAEADDGTGPPETQD